MKYLKIIGIAFLAGVIGCSGGGSATSKGEKMPKWINQPGLYEDAIIVAGIGEGLSEIKAKSQAELSGRKKIAEALQTQIKSLTTNFMEEASTATDKGSQGSAAQEYFQEISQSLTNVTLNGAAVEMYWPAMGMKDGNKIKFYAKVVLKKSALIDAYKKQVQDDIAQKKIKNVKASADDALKALDAAVSKWEKGSMVSEEGGEE